MRVSILVALLLLIGGHLAAGCYLFAAEPLEAAEAKLLKEYKRKIAPLLAGSEQGCVDCHSSQSMSNLVLTGDPLQDLLHLLDDGYLRSSGPDTLLGRIKNAPSERRMPKDDEPWDRKRIRKLEQLLGAISQQQQLSGIAADEQFPRSLLSPSTPSIPLVAPTQFLSYRQLRAKVHAIFEDDWVRGNRDLFLENLAAFGGADFETRFNETTEASPSFLSALEMLSRDVASRAYRMRLGPFADWQDPLLAHIAGDNLPLLAAMNTIYQRVLFRAPTQLEIDGSLELLQAVHNLEQSISDRNTELVFEVSVRDQVTELVSKETISIPVSGERLGLQQSIVDQRRPIETFEHSFHQFLKRWFHPVLEKITRQLFPHENGQQLGKQSLGRITLGPASPGRVIVHNKGTHRNVSLVGIELRNLAGQVIRTIDVDSTDVQVDGAWLREDQGEIKCLADKNQHKGLSTITVALESETCLDVDVVVVWLAKPGNAHNVLLELYGNSSVSNLAPPQQFADVEPGASLFYFDCSNDTVPFVELPGVFQFSQADFVEITNEGTLEQVTAGAIELIDQAEPKNSLLIDSQEAQGVEQWEKFDEGRFKAYNVRGLKVHDNNQHKGERFLKYLIETCVADGWQADRYYRVRVYYPGKRDQEPRVPVTVHARRSSPIVQVAYPLTARSDASVRLDASASFTVQRSSLTYQWRQIAGPAVDVSDWTQPTIEFTAPRQTARELAWVSLCGALLRHPDFLFTHAPSIETGSVLDRRRLLLCKIALDLVGRPPTPHEFERLSAGASLEQLVDTYLDSDDFRDFYFHRVRLYLESQGSALQDEPARLWSYVAFNNRPFQEILTAEYTVDENFDKVSRPAYHGRTGVLTTQGFIDGKPGLPHYNYAAQVSMLFLGYVYEVPPEIVEQREGVTALGTADPNSSCYSCHKILTPLAFQRLNWTDAGEYRKQDEAGVPIDATDHAVVDEYPFKGDGLEAFAIQAVKKERFIRTMINTHVDFYFGRQMEFRDQERKLYKHLWDNVHEHEFKIRSLIKAIVTSPEYLGPDT